MRRNVPNAMRFKSKISQTNLTSDKLADIKEYYGWSERELHQHVNAHLEGASREEKKYALTQYYSKKDGWVRR